MSAVAAPPGWYPDPGRTYEARYFDGLAWTDYVSDRGTTIQVPLGPTPPGLVAWFPPSVMVQSMYAQPALPAVPRVRMWIYAVLSLFVFWVRTPNTVIVLPFGIVFAILCWATTARPLKAHRAAGSAGATEMTAARWVAVGFACLAVLQAIVWSH